MQGILMSGPLASSITNVLLSSPETRMELLNDQLGVYYGYVEETCIVTTIENL